MSKRKGQRTVQENQFCSNAGRKTFLDRHTVSLRDKVLENAILFMNQALIAVDFHQSMRKGEVGRLEADLKIMMINFHGCGKTKYARILLERLFDQHHVWTPEHHYIDIRNNLMNLSGQRDSFVAVDENLELINADLQSVSSNHPPKRHMSEPSGKPPGPASNHPPKRHEPAVGQDAGPASNHPPKRHERAIGQYAGPVSIRTIHRSDTRAIRRASRCRGAACDPALKPQPGGAADIEPNPLDYSL